MQYDKRNNLTWANRHDISFTVKGRVKDEFQEHLPNISSGTILDAGCSYGYTTEELAELYPACKVIGIDINNIQAARYVGEWDKARQAVSNRLWFKTANLYLVDRHFPPRTFEAIFCMNNWIKVEHELSLQQNRMIRQGMESRLKEDGFLCISGQSEYGFDFGRAIFQKKKGRLKPINVNKGFVCEDSFRWMGKTFGLETWYAPRT